MTSTKLFRCIVLTLALFSSGCNRELTVLSAATNLDLCSCGPDLCLKDPRYPPKLAKKKADLKRAGFPDDLIALLDRDGKSVMAINQTPDSFRILLVAPNGDNNSNEWTQHDEDKARKDLLDGKLKVYYKHNVRKVFPADVKRRRKNGQTGIRI